MGDLKTLKDIKEVVIMGFHPADVNIFRDGFSKELKQEAIKYIKAIKGIYKLGDTLFKEHGKIAPGFELDLYDYEQDDCAGAIKFIKYFFNITEEDLQ